MKEDVITEILTRGVVEVISRESLEKKLRSKKKLRVKLGIDPTGPRLHLGRSIPLLKLRDWQDLGHQVVLIVGDFTGQIGDTSDKRSERPMLSSAQVKENMATYLEQVGTILDMGSVEVHYNSEWLAKLTFVEIARLAGAFSVHEFTERDVIKRRLVEGKRVNMREMLYPIMQGYDSIAVKADVEIGGTDQRFNLLAGRTLQTQADEAAQDIMMLELINGTDGEKMSTSRGNTVFLNENPTDMFGQIMSIKDELIIPYLTLLTRVPLAEIKEWETKLQEGENPKNAKLALAKEIVTFYHQAKEAQMAEEHFNKTVVRGEEPTDIPAVSVKAGEYLLPDLLLLLQKTTSKSAGRRLVEQGGVKIDGAVIEDPKALIAVYDGMVITIGKRAWVKITVS